MYDPYAGFETIVLPNGLTVYSLHMPNRPQSLSFIVHNGSKHDPEGKVGLAHFTEHMMSANSPADHLELQDYFGSFGGSVNLGTTNFFGTWYTFKLPNEAPPIAQGLALMGTMLLGTSLEKSLERERSVIVGEYHQGVKFEEVVTLEMRRRALLFPGHWFTRCKTALGTLAAISEISLEDIQEFHRMRYVPANMSIVSVGGMETKEMIALLSASLLGNERPGERNPDFVQPVPFVPPETTFERVDLSSIMKGLTSPGFESFGKIPRQISSGAVLLFHKMLNETLNEEVREKRAWTYSIGSNWGPFDSFYEFNVVCSSFSPEAQDELPGVVSDCIRRLPDDRLLFEKMKRRRLATFLMEDSTASSIEANATKELVRKGAISTNQEDHDEIDSLRLEDLHAIADALGERFRYTRILHP